MATNFEKIKLKIYHHVRNNQDFKLKILGGECITFHKKVDEAEKKLWKLLNGIDIRSISNILKEHPEISMPKWIKFNQYVIDYNSKGELDLIRIKP